MPADEASVNPPGSGDEAVARPGVWVIAPSPVSGTEPDTAKRTFVIHVCPECGEHITEREYDSARGHYYGHYHDPPEGWLDEDGVNPHGTGEDPWIDAVEVEVALLAEFSGPATARPDTKEKH